MNKSDWISVKERLPEPDTDVLTYGEYENIVGYLDPIYGTWEAAWKDFESGEPYLTNQNVTHWMLLPCPPEEGE